MSIRSKKDDQSMVITDQARLVAKGITQIPGRDFTEVFFPISRHSTLRMVISLSFKRNWKRSSLDKKHAFVDSELKGKIHANESDRFAIKRMNGHVYRLQKTLYCLLYASQKCHALLHRFLKTCDVNVVIWIQHFIYFVTKSGLYSRWKVLMTSV